MTGQICVISGDIKNTIVKCIYWNGKIPSFDDAEYSSLRQCNKYVHSMVISNCLSK